MIEQGIQWRDMADMANRVFSPGGVARTQAASGGNFSLAVLVFLPFLMGLAVYGAGRRQRAAWPGYLPGRTHSGRLYRDRGTAAGPSAGRRILPGFTDHAAAPV